MAQNTSAMEMDAIRLHSKGGRENAGDIAVGVVVGRSSEFFDFFVYAIASVVVFPQLLFPEVDRLTATLYSFLIFPLAFAARPFGTAFFLAVDRRYGRSAKLTGAMMLLGTATAAIAFLPSYGQIGASAVWLLALARVGQGLAWGGTWDGLAPLLAIHAPQKRAGLYAMLPQLGAPIGLIIASLLFAYVLAALPTEDFYAWGWRYPFFVALALNIVALFARLRIVVTPLYEEMFEKSELRPTPAGETLRNEFGTILIGAFAPLATFAMFHMITVFPLSWIDLFTEQTVGRFLLIQACGAAIGILAIILSGRISDAFGRRTLLAACAVAIAVFSGFAPLLLGGGSSGQLAFMLLGFALFGLSFGQSSGIAATRFAKRYRYTASALTNDFAWLIGAGMAPLAALLLASNFGLLAAGAYLLSGAACTLIALHYNRRIGLTEA
ncbi:MFS transporter [Xanthobacteraceae bacterium A53D]